MVAINKLIFKKKCDAKLRFVSMAFTCNAGKNKIIIYNCNINSDDF